MSAESTGVVAQLNRGRVAFRHWRWERPFWAGLLTMLAGLPIGYIPYNNVTFGQLTVRMATTAGFGGIIIGFLLALVGGAMAIAWVPGKAVPDAPEEKAELPDGDPEAEGDTAGPGAPTVPAPATPADPFTPPEPVHAGARADEETIEENGRHRAG